MREIIVFFYFKYNSIQNNEREREKNENKIMEIF